MEQSQRELRRAAARAFMESLEQLEDSLQSSRVESTGSGIPAPLAGTTPPRPSKPGKDYEALAAAAADIEQFMQTQNGN